MRKILSITILAMMFLSSVQVSAGDKKEREAMMRTVIKTMEVGDAVMDSVPLFLLFDHVASDYCNGILYHGEAQYTMDTVMARKVIRAAEWIMSHQCVPDEKMRKKLLKQNCDAEKLPEYYAWADMILRDLQPRYSTLTDFCERQLQHYREAMQRTMPEGRLVSFAYREFGSSRPDPVEYELNYDKEMSCWLLNGFEVDASVAEEVRTLAERRKVYQCMSYYPEAPHFKNAPRLLGGPPSWSFRCQFEGGTISTGSECRPVPDACYDIVVFLRKTLDELNVDNPSVSDFITMISRKDYSGELMGFIGGEWRKYRHRQPYEGQFTDDSANGYVRHEQQWKSVDGVSSCTTEYRLWDCNDGRGKMIGVATNYYENGKVVDGQYAGLSLYVFDVRDHSLELVDNRDLGAERPDTNSLITYELPREGTDIKATIHDGKRRRTIVYVWNGRGFNY